MDKNYWDNLVLKNGGDFLQSYQWGDFQKSIGKKVERIESKSFLLQVVFNPLPLGFNYGYIPRGPIGKGTILKDDFLERLNSLKKKGTIFWEADLLKSVDFLSPTSKDTRQPRQTTMVDLFLKEGEIESNFHKNHRYSIRQAEKQGVEIRKEKDWKSFFAILQKTAKEQNFRVWPKIYYEKIWNSLGSVGMAEIISAYHKGEVIASNLYILFSGRATHLFGGSDSEKRDLMAPHALHWHAIKDFKRRGFTEYDFWGVDDKKWPGLTRFKERFGGRRVEYPGSYTKVLQPTWYKAYKLAQKIRR